ncbi:hypothetical protein PMAYCL1PPCAC_09621, partial [Pristionchus mayeri]
FSGVNVLKVTRKERIPDSTWIYQTDDGTIFYYYYVSPKKLYVKWMGNNIYARLPGEDLAYPSVHGNAMYFVESTKKIYKVMFTPSNGIQGGYLRDLSEGEKLHGSGLCSRLRDGQRYVYGMWEDPNRAGIIIDVPPHILDDHIMRRVHRGKVIFTNINNLPEENCPKVVQLSEKVIVIEAPENHPAIYVNDYSPFIYIANKEEHIYVHDTRTMEPLQLADADYIAYVAGVHNGEITVYATMSDGWYLVTAQLPREYVRWNNLTTAQHSEETVSRINRNLTNRNNGSGKGFESEFLKKFKPKKIIGQGAFGCVFEAENIVDEWIYAVKRIAISHDEETHNEILREVRMMARLDHPGIVRYHNTWLEYPAPGKQMKVDLQYLDSLGKPSTNYRLNYPYNSAFVYVQMQISPCCGRYICSRFVQLCKYSLGEWLDSNRASASRSLHKIKHWFKQIISAIAYIHKKGIIHRDLKPANILIFEEDTLKVCDLGLSTPRVVEEGGTEGYRTGEIGTVMYMSPEQNVAFPKYSSKTDVFALGLIFIEMCEWKPHTS